MAFIPERSMRESSLLVLLVVSMATPGAGIAQETDARARTVPDGTLALELSVLEPRGDFRPGATVAVGYGVRGALGWGPRRAFDIGLAFRSIAHDSREYSDTIDVRNMMRTLAVSARYTLPFGSVHPYVGGSAGAAYFGTETYVDRCCDENGDRERSFHDVRLAHLKPTASTRFGVAIDLWRILGPNPSTMLADLGIETHYGGRSTYQVGGRGPVRTTGTRYRLYSLGITVRTR